MLVISVPWGLKWGRCSYCAIQWTPKLSKLVPYKHKFWNSKQFSHVDITCLNNTAVGWLTSNEMENIVKTALLLPGLCQYLFSVLHHAMLVWQKVQSCPRCLCTEFILFPVFTWDTGDDIHHCEVTQFYSYIYWDEIQFHLDVLISSSENPSLIQHTPWKITVSHTLFWRNTNLSFYW